MKTPAHFLAFAQTASNQRGMRWEEKECAFVFAFGEDGYSVMRPGLMS